MVKYNYTVYVHISPSNKRYVGITRQNIKNRWKNGAGYKSGYFHNAINKYGWNNFKHIIIAENLSCDDAKEMEKLLIATYKSNNKKYGYNLTNGGDGMNGFKPSEETKEKISNSLKGNIPWNKGKTNIYTKESLNKMSVSAKNRKKVVHFKHTEETKEKIRLAAKKRVGKLSSFYGKHHTEETKKKISDSRKGKTSGEKHYNYGKHLSEDTKKKISDSLTGKMSGEKNPMYGTKRSDISLCKSVICVNTLEIFRSITEAATYYNIMKSDICKCCKGIIKSSGKHPVTGERLIWVYYNQWLSHF